MAAFLWRFALALPLSASVLFVSGRDSKNLADKAFPVGATLVLQVPGEIIISFYPSRDCHNNILISNAVPSLSPIH